MKGLTTEEAERLLNQYGLNAITEQKKKPILVKLFEQFNNFLTILLIFAAFLSFFSFGIFYPIYRPVLYLESLSDSRNF